MKDEDIIERLKTARYVSEIYQPLSWQGTVDFLEYAMAQDVQPDATNERIAELIAQYTAETKAAGHELYQPEHLLRRYRALLRSLAN
jgi:hypothetical protein